MAGLSRRTRKNICAKWTRRRTRYVRDIKRLRDIRRQVDDFIQTGVFRQRSIITPSYSLSINQTRDSIFQVLLQLRVELQRTVSAIDLLVGDVFGLPRKVGIDGGGYAADADRDAEAEDESEAQTGLQPVQSHRSVETAVYGPYQAGGYQARSVE